MYKFFSIGSFVKAFLSKIDIKEFIQNEKYFLFKIFDELLSFFFLKCESFLRQFTLTYPL